MTRWRNRCSSGLALALLAIAGCSARERPMIFPTAAPADEAAKRHPPGVSVDPPAALPEASAGANADRGIVVLVSPRDAEAARDVVREFFRTAVGQSKEELLALFAVDARVVTGHRARPENAGQFWQQRLEQLDYGVLAGRPVFRESELETYRAEDLSELRQRRRLRVSMSPDQVLIRVPIAEARVGRVRLFGDEILFLLQPAPTGYKITTMHEEFRLR